MKNSIIYIYALFLVSFLFISCEEEKTMMYDVDRAAINFVGKKGQYSFLVSGVLKDTVGIKIKINGLAKDFDRQADFEVVQDSTTVEESEYRILYSSVEANSLEGELFIELTRPNGETFDDRRLYLRASNSDDFIVGIEDYKDYQLLITNKLTPPINWTPKGWISRYFLGNYSTAYYQFIIDVTGETQIPVWPIEGYNDGKEWNSAEIDAFEEILKFELKKYNASIAPNKLLHDDGLAKGSPVVIGKFYDK